MMGNNRNVTDMPQVPHTPYIEFDRDEWAALAGRTPLPLTEADIAKVRGLEDPVDVPEVDTIYRPLSRLIDLYHQATTHLHHARQDFLNQSHRRTPFVIAVAGSVAVGKSTTARLLRELMSRWPSSPHVELVTTDGFLYPNEELRSRGLLGRKGFPESYNRRALRDFVAHVKSGVDQVKAPVYSHLSYDIVPGEHTVVTAPDILILEGLNVLQPAPRTSADGSHLAVSDFLDMSIYVDADAADIRQWYIDRFLSLRKKAFALPESYFHSYADLSDDEARSLAADVWDSINAPNLVKNIAPTRERATIILHKGADHSVEQVRMRKL